MVAQARQVDLVGLGGKVLDPVRDRLLAAPPRGLRDVVDALMRS